MGLDTRLDSIRENLFYGLLDYTKSFPDFSIPQRFSMASPREATGFLDHIKTSLRDENEILIYIHLPFCRSECVFCNAFPKKASQRTQGAYVDGLMAESEIYSKSGIFDGKKVKCLYFGGGSPSVFSSDDLRRILGKLRSSADLSDDCSISFEAHPNDLVGNDRVQELSDLGIHRLSIGCQTFDPKVLDLCQRSNSESDVRELTRRVQALGLSLNIDMMIGLPGQTVDGVIRDLDILSDIAPNSIEYMRHEIVNPLAASLYRKNPDLLVDNDDLFAMVLRTQRWMEEKGYEQNGHFRSEQQFPYRYHWLKEVPFIALGSRSRSYTKTICYDKHEDLSLYLRLLDRGVLPIARHMVLSGDEQMYRSLLLNLQIRAGLDQASFANRFGESAGDVFSGLLKRLADYGCLVVDDSSIRLSKYGRYFVEDVCCFIIDHALNESQVATHFKRIPHSSGAFFDRRVEPSRPREPSQRR